MASQLEPSTVTNVISCDAAIADIMMVRHAYDIVSFDFKAAFDKAPHNLVIEALADKSVSGNALSWYANFLTGKTQQIKVGDGLSIVGNVLSGVIHGLACGPGLYKVLADSLLRKIDLPRWSYADDFKFVADVTERSRAEEQSDVDIVVRWSSEYHMPLSCDKCGVMHCGYANPNDAHYIHGCPMAEFASFKNLGFVRSQDGGYVGHCQAVAAKANKIAGAVRKIFQLRQPQLLWPAFQNYVLPVAMSG